MSVGGAMVAGMSPDLDALIAEATVDRYGDDEQLTGLFTMIDECLVVPFDSTVLGVTVTVREVELTVDGRIVARVRSRGVEQPLSLLDLPLPDPPPGGVEWVEVFRVGRERRAGERVPVLRVRGDRSPARRASAQRVTWLSTRADITATRS